MNIRHRALSDSDFSGCATKVRQRYCPLAMSTIVQNPVFTADPTYRFMQKAVFKILNQLLLKAQYCIFQMCTQGKQRADGLKFEPRISLIIDRAGVHCYMLLNYICFFMCTMRLFKHTQKVNFVNKMRCKIQKVYSMIFLTEQRTVGVLGKMPNV